MWLRPVIGSFPAGPFINYGIQEQINALGLEMDTIWESHPLFTLFQSFSLGAFALRTVGFVSGIQIKIAMLLHTTAWMSSSAAILGTCKLRGEVHIQRVLFLSFGQTIMDNSIRLSSRSLSV